MIDYTSYLFQNIVFPPSFFAVFYLLAHFAVRNALSRRFYLSVFSFSSFPFCFDIFLTRFVFVPWYILISVSFQYQVVLFLSWLSSQWEDSNIE